MPRATPLNTWLDNDNDNGGKATLPPQPQSLLHLGILSCCPSPPEARGQGVATKVDGMGSRGVDPLFPQNPRHYTGHSCLEVSVLELVEECDPLLLVHCTAVRAARVGDEDLTCAKLDEHFLHQLQWGLDLDGDRRLDTVSAMMSPLLSSVFCDVPQILPTHAAPPYHGVVR